MKIKDILRNDIPISLQCIEVNGEQYDECKHGDLIHIDTEIETQEEHSNILNTDFYRPKVKFTAIEREKVLKLLKEKDADNSLSAYLDKRIKEIAKE
jgi:hypothetical protein